MKKRDVVITVAVTNIMSIAITFFIMVALKTDKQQVRNEKIVPEKETTAASASPVAAQQDVNKIEILALFDVNTESLRKKSIEAFKKVIRDVPPYTETPTRGYPFALKGEYQQAEQITQEEIRDNPQSVDAHYTLAWIYARVGNYDDAISLCNRTLQRGSAFNKLRHILAWVYARQEKYEDALNVCDEAIRDEPHSAMLYYAKARIQDLFGRDDEAIENYSRAISLKNDFFEAYVFRGLLYTKLGRYDDAIKDQRQAIRFDRYAPAGYIGLGLVFDITRNYAAALEQMNSAVTLGSLTANVNSQRQPLTVSMGIDDAVIYNKIGILNIRLGFYQDALTAFNRAIAVRQEFPDAYRGLVLTHLLLGNREAALKNYEKLKSLDLNLANSVVAFLEQGN